MGLFDAFGNKSKSTAKKARKGSKNSKSSGGKKRRGGGGSTASGRKLGAISKRASKIYQSGQARTWGAAMRKAAKG